MRARPRTSPEYQDRFSIMTNAARAAAAEGAQWKVLILCFLVSVIEGIEIVAFGVAAPDIHATLGVGHADLGLLGSAGVIGLIFGAFFGGRIADQVGRKRLLILCVLGFTLFTLLAALSQGFDALLIARLGTGISIGMSMPNIIAMGAEAGGTAGQIPRVTLVTSGTPAGGVVAGLFAASVLYNQWQDVFIFGVIMPALLLPFLIFLLPPDRARAHRPADDGKASKHLASYRAVLFGDRRTVSTVSLWAAGFCNQVIIYLLLNWLPTLMRAVGATHEEGGMAMALFNMGGLVGGVLFGRMMQGNKRWPIPLIAYSGTIIGLCILAIPGIPVGVRLTASLLVGTCAIGSQLLIFGFSAETYTARFRGTGVGVSAAIGRVGSTVGPAVAGFALGAGATVATLLPALLPLALIAGAASITLAMRPRPIEAKDAVSEAEKYEGDPAPAAH